MNIFKELNKNADERQFYLSMTDLELFKKVIKQTTLSTCNIRIPIRLGFTEIVKVILSEDIKVDIDKGLEMAISCNNEDITNILVKRGAKLSVNLLNRLNMDQIETLIDYWSTDIKLLKSVLINALRSLCNKTIKLLMSIEGDLIKQCVRQDYPYFINSCPDKVEVFKVIVKCGFSVTEELFKYLVNDTNIYEDDSDATVYEYKTIMSYIIENYTSVTFNYTYVWNIKTIGLNPIKYLINDDSILTIDKINDLTRQCIYEDRFDIFELLCPKITIEYFHNVIDTIIRLNMIKYFKLYIKSFKAPISEWNLVAAAEKGNKEMAELIIKTGTNINFENSRIIKSAAWYGNYEVVKLLIEHGSKGLNNAAKSIVIRDNECVPKNKMEILKLLLENGADPNVILTKVCSLNIIKYLLDYAGKVNFQLDEKMVECYKYETIIMLLENGAKVSELNNIILKHCDYRTIKLLLENGAKILTLDNNILGYCSDEIVKLLFANGTTIYTDAILNLHLKKNTLLNLLKKVSNYSKY